MAMINCPECGKEISDKADKCIHCGCPIVDQKKQEKYKIYYGKETTVNLEMLTNDFPKVSDAAKKLSQIAKIDYYEADRVVRRYLYGDTLREDGKKKPTKEGGLSTLACICSILTCTCFIGFILGIIDLCINGKDGKRHLGSKFAIIWAVLAFLLFASTLSEEEEAKKPQKVNEVSVENNSESENNNQNNHADKFSVGDVVEADGWRITFISSKEYKSDNQFIQPRDGYIYWEFKFKFENISKEDKGLSSLLGWECYADDSMVDQKIIGDNNGLDGTLSSGRKTEGTVYFEIPVDAKSIELEFKDNVWADDKVIFIGK